MVTTTVVAIVSSPRRNGNSGTIVNEMVKAIREEGKEVKVHHLNVLKDARGCQACMACKRAGRCTLMDDIEPILEDIRMCEGLILSTPCYFGEACGQFRLLQDRFFGFMNDGFVPNIEAQKKLSVVVTCGSGTDAAKELQGKIERSMVQFFGFKNVGGICMSKGNPPDVAANSPGLLEEARKIGGLF
ncbi:MAG: flavodoxin family protein [Thermoplasmatales archaeon]|nr:flavodoxin family protein [Thermoplasmatales archaeon]